MTTPAQTSLALAKTYIEKGWTQRTYARDHFNEPCRVSDDSASKFCALGAVTKVSLDAPDSIWMQSTLGWALEKAAEQLGVFPAIATYNDGPFRTKEEILALFDEALRILEKEGV
jgi:hypothetical protein